MDYRFFKSLVCYNQLQYYSFWWRHCPKFSHLGIQMEFEAKINKNGHHLRMRRTSRFPHANRCTRHHVHVTSCGPTGAMAESLPRRVSMPPWAGHLRPPTPAWARGSVPLPEDGCDKTPATSPGQAAEKPEPWPLLVGAENGAAAVEDKSAVP